MPNPPNYVEKSNPYADNWGPFRPGEREKLEQWRRIYYAMTANLDWNVGRLMDVLDAAGQRQNTVLVFTSDHGEMLGAQGLKKKNVFFEEAARIPFLMRMPGALPAGSVSDACLGTVDILPTLLSMLGLGIPAEVEGMDLSKAARGERCAEPEAALLQNIGACAAWKNGHEWRAVRDKRYTYARYRVDGNEMLFDNQADPYQINNLAKDKAYRDTLGRLRAFVRARIQAIVDTKEKSTWHRDHWIEDRWITQGARGDPAYGLARGGGIRHDTVRPRGEHGCTALRRGSVPGALS